MPGSSLPVSPVIEDLVAYHWVPQPEATRLAVSLVDECVLGSRFAAELSRRMFAETGTRLFDWIDHISIPEQHAVVSQLWRLGFQLQDDHASQFWIHPAGMLPKIRVMPTNSMQLAIKVESVVDFIAAQRLYQVDVQGTALAPLRRAMVAAENGVEVWIIERHGSRAFEVAPDQKVPLEEIARYTEAFRLRRRDYDSDEEGFVFATQLIDSAIQALGKDRVCDLFFSAEREYWWRRNRAGRIQKSRQDSLGLGWANHDHHTYRSSRRCFSWLIGLLERMGFVCRERFYAGREAGWGAQVIEHPVTGVTIFADVDLSAEELSQDFAHEPLPARKELGTVGMWCALHGEAFLQAGMHHLECQFDFLASRDQLERVGIESMAPFTDYPYLKQSFTKGEVWTVNPERTKKLREANQISVEQEQHFNLHGALGSHLEILQRNDGYKGFNQQGINQIISATDPRHGTKSHTSNSTGAQ